MLCAFVERGFFEGCLHHSKLTIVSSHAHNTKRETHIHIYVTDIAGKFKSFCKLTEHLHMHNKYYSHVDVFNRCAYKCVYVWKDQPNIKTKPALVWSDTKLKIPFYLHIFSSFEFFGKFFMVHKPTESYVSTRTLFIYGPSLVFGMGLWFLLGYFFSVTVSKPMRRSLVPWQYKSRWYL